MKKILSMITAIITICSLATLQADAITDVEYKTIYTYHSAKEDLLKGRGNTDILEVIQKKNDVIQESKQDFLYKPEGVLYKGIDVSSYQGLIDWNWVKEQGVEFVILRAGYVRASDETMCIDPYFEVNYQKCKDLGIPVGCYWFTRARSTTQAEAEADYFLNIIQGKQFEYPVCFDIESESLTNLSSDVLTNITIAFCNRVEQNNYYVSIYTNPSWIDYRLVKQNLTDYDKWLAHWTTTPKYGNEFGGLWQYGIGTCLGIEGDCDVNYSYRDYPSIIKGAGLNGF